MLIYDNKIDLASSELSVWSEYKALARKQDRTSP